MSDLFRSAASTCIAATRMSGLRSGPFGHAWRTAKDIQRSSPSRPTRPRRRSTTERCAAMPDSGRSGRAWPPSTRLWPDAPVDPWRGRGRGVPVSVSVSGDWGLRRFRCPAGHHQRL